MESLDSIMVDEQSDKATVFFRTYAKPKGYTLVYEKFFEPIRGKPIKFLEVGTGGGESIKGWLRYFTWAKVYGIDITCKTNAWNDPDTSPDPRYKFIHADVNDATMWKCLAADTGGGFAAVVEDGSHVISDIIASFNGAWPLLKEGGLFCAEDIGVGSDPGSVFLRPGFPSHLEWACELIRKVNSPGSDIQSVHVSRELVILTKSCQKS